VFYYTFFFWGIFSFSFFFFCFSAFGYLRAAQEKGAGLERPKMSLRFIYFFGVVFFFRLFREMIPKATEWPVEETETPKPTKKKQKQKTTVNLAVNREPLRKRFVNGLQFWRKKSFFFLKSKYN